MAVGKKKTAKANARKSAKKTVKRGSIKTKGRTATEAPVKIKRMVKALTLEDVKLGLPLLDAAVSGAVIGFNPKDTEMRAQAAKAWNTIRPLLSQHLLAEEGTVLPWAEEHGDLPHSLVERMMKRHQELRSLTRLIGATHFRTASDHQVMKAGKALCVLAVRLDDLIDGEERRLLPTLRRYVFAPMEGGAQESAGC